MQHTTPARAAEEARIVAKRGGQNIPMEFLPLARWDGWRSVRLGLGGRDIGIATAAYSYALTDEEKTLVARRIAALWNLAALKGWTTEEVEAQASALGREGAGS